MRCIVLNLIHSLYINGYKCFEEGDYLGVPEVKKLNIFIGRNNSGKSSFLDILSFILDTESFFDNFRNFKEIIVGCRVTTESIKTVFNGNTSGGGIPGPNHFSYGQKFVGEVLYFRLLPKTDYDRRTVVTDCVDFNGDGGEFPSKYKSLWNAVANLLLNKVKELIVLKLGAERNIIPEQEEQILKLNVNGEGATNIIRGFLNLSTMDSTLVEKQLLSLLNQILYPDSLFTDIVVQQVEYGDGLYWEIFLEEEDKGRIALSKSGSGLKTIILVLIQLLLLPKVKKKNPSEIVYIMEELENNLHPQLQRNLFKFIYEWSIKHNVTLFITTHSHIPINMFSALPDANIIHLRNEDNKITPRVTLSYEDSAKILADLDVKASDLLQSNGIIWVEGPTDRMYLNKWLEIYSQGRLREGLQYQVVYYGGRLLSHYSAGTAEATQEELINFLLTNRNCAIVIDSDKKAKTTRINDTKKRIRKEFEDKDLFVWITKGKEIENYIPASTITEMFGNQTNGEFGLYMNIKDYLEGFKKGEGVRYERNKVAFANKVIPLLKKENLDDTYDLKIRIESLVDTIDSWNK